MAAHLYQLIRRMTKTEKAYFKKFGIKQGGKTADQSLLLFDIAERYLKGLESNEAPDEEVLLKKLSKKIDLKYFSKLKNSLYNALLSSLRSYSFSTDIEEQIFDHYRKSKILYEKNLSDQANSFAEKALSQSSQTGKAELSQLIYSNPAILAQEDYGDKHIEKIDEAITHLKVVKERLQINKFYNEIFAFQKFHKGSTDEVKRYFQNALQNPMLKINAQSVETEFKLEVIRYTIYSGLIDIDKAIQSGLKILQVLDDNPEFNQSLPGAYLVGLFNVINFASQTNRGEVYQKLFPVLRNYKPENRYYQIKKEQYLINSSVSYHLIRNELEEINYFDRRFGALVESASDEMQPTYLLYTSFDLMCVNFVLGDYDRAFYWSSVYESQPIYGKWPTESKLYSGLFKLIMHYELGNTLLIPYLIRSVLNQFKKANILSDFENEIFKMVQALLKVKNKDGLERLLESNLEKLQQLFEEGRSQDSYLLHGYIFAWIKSKLLEIPYREAWAAEVISEEYR